MGVPARDDELDESLDDPRPEGEEESPDEPTHGLDVELDSFEEPEDPAQDREVILPVEDPFADDPHDDDDAGNDGGPNDLPDEASALLELPDDGTDDAPSGLTDEGDDLLGDERSIDDGGEEGFRDEDDPLDEISADDALEPDGPDGLDVSSSEALPPWADARAERAEPGAADVRFDLQPVSADRRELAVGADADGTRLTVMDDEEGAVFLRGDTVVSDNVPELPLSGIAMLGETPVYWVEGEGLLVNQVYIAGTEGLVAMAASERGLVLALSARGEHVLALWREGSSPERIADLRSVPLELRVRGTTVAVSAVAGLEVFTLP